MTGYGMRQADYHNIQPRKFEIKPPELRPGIVPAGESAPVIAMDSLYSGFDGSMQVMDNTGFPGYQYLAMLATRAEYRQMASAYSTEMTREWITLNSTETSGESTKKKIPEITKMLEDLGIQQLIASVFEDDFFFGRGQVGITVKGVDSDSMDKPLVINPRTLPRWDGRSVATFPVKFKKIEPMWTTPAIFNANDPFTDDYYKPTKWYVMGRQVHWTRIPMVITRPLPDLLKPAFNFSGMSGSQLAEPYVNNWLRTRQSVSDLINNFSIIVLKTKMGTLLQSSTSLINRIKLFIANRSNNGLMVVDNAEEDLGMQNVPLSGLHELQSQSQEHLCAVSRMPAVILTGISPQGLNPSADGEIRVFYDWIHAQQEAHARKLIKYLYDIIQMVMYGEVDEDITFSFDPLYQMTPKELAEIKKSEAEADQIYTSIGAIDGLEVRQRIASDPRTGYSGLDLNKTIEMPDDGFDEDGNSNDEKDKE